MFKPSELTVLPDELQNTYQWRDCQIDTGD